MTELTRRQLLAGAAIYGGMTWVSLHWPRTARAAQESAKPLTLSPHEWRTVESIAARIVPSDDGSPGATEAGCVNFVDKALAHEESELRPAYATGLRAVDAVSTKRHAKPFAELDSESQDALLVALQDGAAEGWPSDAGPSGDFFETLRTHSLMGFLADPKYGGNRNWVGWKHVGYPGARHEVGGYSAEQMLGKAPIRSVWEADV